jgi:hypothetical protein
MAEAESGRRASRRPRTTEIPALIEGSYERKRVRSEPGEPEWAWMLDEHRGALSQWMP